MIKKVSWPYILKQFGIILIVCILLGIVSIFVSPSVNGAMFDFFLVFGLSFFCGMLYWLTSLFNNPFDSKKNKKRIEEFLKEYHFKQSEVIYSTNAVMMVDGVDNRIGYVSKYNPKEFQLLHADKISDLKVDYNIAPELGVKLVYFSFRYGKQKIMIPTFSTVKWARLMKSEEVVAGVEKAKHWCQLLQCKENTDFQNGI